MFGSASILSLTLPQPRRICQLERQEIWFETMWEHRDDNGYQTWKANFRMSGESFQKLVRLNSSALIKRDSQFRRAIAVEKRVAIAIWRLSTENSFKNIAKVFAVGKSTVVTICKEFCRELKRRSSEYISFLVTLRENAEAILKFKADVNCKIPQAVGVIDGTHIPILNPATESKGDYYSRKKRHTINTQAVAGANLMLSDVATGFPGCMHDARVLQHTALFRMARQGGILSKPSDQINSVTIQSVLLGDGAYPLSTWTLKPYAYSPNLTRAQKKFKKKLSSARVSSEKAFGLLKARRRCLLKILDNQIENISEVIIS